VVANVSVTYTHIIEITQKILTIYSGSAYKLSLQH
jgi:hypothetical protein